MGFIYLPLGHDLGPVVGGMLQTQLTDGADKRPMSVFCIVTRHMLRVSGLAHLGGDDQEHHFMTLLWLQKTSRWTHLVTIYIIISTSSKYKFKFLCKKGRTGFDRYQ